MQQVRDTLEVRAVVACFTQAPRPVFPKEAKKERNAENHLRRERYIHNIGWQNRG